MAAFRRHPRPREKILPETDGQRSFLFVLGSSRPNGNTEALARAAAAQLPAHVTQSWIYLSQLSLPDFQDGRHDGDTWIPSKAEETLRRLTLAATDVVLASPLYWYTLSAQMKRYLDYWSGWLTEPGSDFHERMAGRTLWGVTAMSDHDEAVADGLLTTLNHTAAYMHMRFGGVLLGNGSGPGQVRTDTRAAGRAEAFFHQEAPVAQFPHQGRERRVPPASARPEATSPPDLASALPTAGVAIAGTDRGRGTGTTAAA